MASNETIKSRWISAILQLVVFSLGLIVLFAIIYWGIDELNWRGLQDQARNRIVGFLPFLYFSIETFFTLNMELKHSIEAIWVTVTLEALLSVILSSRFSLSLISRRWV